MITGLMGRGSCVFLYDEDALNTPEQVTEVQNKDYGHR